MFLFNSCVPFFCVHLVILFFVLTLMYVVVFIFSNYVSASKVEFRQGRDRAKSSTSRCSAEYSFIMNRDRMYTES